MFREAAQAPAIVTAQVARNRGVIAAAAERLRAINPAFAATLARGSSDHAATFAKFLFETRLALPTLSHSPSIGALYGATSPRFRNRPLFAISQSGRSPDLLRAAEGVRAAGGLVTALVNDVDSPLAGLADPTIPLLAGAETSVAATKSFVATLAALLHLTAIWSDDTTLGRAVDALGDTLDTAWTSDWSAAVQPIARTGRMLVLGRGPTLAIAGEAALKLKESCGIHAEAFSIAEVAHGPMTLVEQGDVVLAFGPLDQARAGLADRIAAFVERGATVIASGHADDIRRATIRLDTEPDLHPLIAPVAQILSFYRLADATAVARGRDPDHPPFLSKVTRTL